MHRLLELFLRFCTLALRRYNGDAPGGRLVCVLYCAKLDYLILKRQSECWKVDIQLQVLAGIGA